jgi:hypothetical protein
MKESAPQYRRRYAEARDWFFIEKGMEGEAINLASFIFENRERRIYLSAIDHACEIIMLLGTEMEAAS